MSVGASQRVSPTTRNRPVLIALAAAAAIYVALEFWLSRGTTMFIDEVSMFQQNVGLHPSALLAPFNEHLELARRLVLAIGFKLFPGAGTFVLAKAVLAVGVVALAWVFFTFLERRVGAVAALPATILLLFFGSGWELDFVISGIGSVYAMATGIGALLALERGDRRGDVAACGLLLVSVVCFSTGLAFAVGALCLLVVQPAQRRRLWVGLVALVIYATWLLWVRFVYLKAHPGAQPVQLSNVLLITNEIAQQLSATAGAMAGVNYNFAPTGLFTGVFGTTSDYGGVLVAFALSALVWRLRKGSTPMLWSLLAALLTYEVELAIAAGFGRAPATARYTYAAAAISMLIAAEAWRRPVRARPRLIVLYGLTAFALLGNLQRLREGMQFFRTFATTERAELAAIAIAQPSVSPGFETDLGFPSFTPVTAGPYLAAVARNGSPAYSATILAEQSAGARMAADVTLLKALPLRLSPAPGALSGLHCRHAAASSRSSLSLTVSPPGVVLDSPGGGQVTAGQFSAGVPLGTLPAGRAQSLQIPRDESMRPWRITITPAPAQLSVCSLPATG